MIRILGKIPPEIAIAFSGGVDSAVVLDFLYKRKHKITLLHFNHHVENSELALATTKETAEKYNVDLIIKDIENSKSKDQSPEEYLRTERIKFFREYGKDIISCHHLNDCIEQWIFSCANGNPKIIPYRTRNVFKPFLLNTKADIYEYANKYDLLWAEDFTNLDFKYKRNYIRHNVVDKFKEINPGIEKVIRKKVLSEYSNYSKSL